jgi:hypothetical protein
MVGEVLNSEIKLVFVREMLIISAKFGIALRV